MKSAGMRIASLRIFTASWRYCCASCEIFWSRFTNSSSNIQCHPEPRRRRRISSAPQASHLEILRFAQDDTEPLAQSVHFRHGQKRHDHVEFLVRLARERKAETLHHARAHFRSDIRRQAVHVECVARSLHPPLVTDPILVLAIALQRAFLDRFEIAALPLEHQIVGTPAFWIN